MAVDANRIEDIFEQALTRNDSRDRAAFLTDVCAGDAELRQRVEALLAAHENAGSFLNLPDSANAAPTIDPFVSVTERAGSTIGRYKLLEQIGEGGFALAIGDPGTGKSAALRILAEHLGNLRDVVVGVLSRPQASLADFYRELGHLFSVPLAPHNRWASAHALREKWLHHTAHSLYLPVLLIDEAQEMTSSALSELRLLSSAELDARAILTTDTRVKLASREIAIDGKTRPSPRSRRARE